MGRRAPQGRAGPGRARASVGPRDWLAHRSSGGYPLAHTTYQSASTLLSNLDNKVTKLFSLLDQIEEPPSHSLYTNTRNSTFAECLKHSAKTLPSVILSKAHSATRVGKQLFGECFLSDTRQIFTVCKIRPSAMLGQKSAQITYTKKSYQGGHQPHVCSPCVNFFFEPLNYSD